MSTRPQGLGTTGHPKQKDSGRFLTAVAAEPSGRRGAAEAVEPNEHKTVKPPTLNCNPKLQTEDCKPKTENRKPSLP